MASTSDRLRSLGRFLARHADLALPALATLTVVLGTWPIWPWTMEAGDALSHLRNARDVLEALQYGVDPLGRLPQQIGSPVFRFYQPLHALATGAMAYGTGLNLDFCLTFVTYVPFALSPWAYRYLVGSLGFSRWTASIAAFVSLTTVFGFSNSFLGLINGIVSQAPAALFFPLFLGKFVRVLRGERCFLGAGAFFALTAVSHAAFAVYAVFAAGLATAVLWPKDLRAFGRAAACGALGVVLAAFWLVPFLSYHAQHRPIPDSVGRGGVEWFRGLSGPELSELVVTGRFFDGERDEERVEGTDEHLDTTIRNLNIFGMHEPLRPPVLTWALVLAALVALVRMRHAHVRYLLCLSFFGVLLVLGDDEFRVLSRLPLMSNMQGFRATYLIDQGALGLLAYALHEVSQGLVRLGGRLPAWPRRAGAALGLLAVAGAVAITMSWLARHAWRYANPMSQAAWTVTLQRNLDAHRARTGPYRLQGVFKNGGSSHENLLSRLGYRVPCSHVKGFVEQSSRAVCGHLGAPARSYRFAELVGVGYYLVDNRLPLGMGDIPRDEREGKRFRRLSDVRTHQLWESRDRSYAHVATGPIVLVVADDAQWLLVVEKWLDRYARKVSDAETPWPVRARPADLRGGELLRAASAVAILDPSGVPRAPRALVAFANDSPVHAVAAIPGLEAVRLLGPQDAWSLPFTGLGRAEPRAPGERIRLVSWLRPGREFRFRVDLGRAGLVAVAETAFRNWTAHLDGRSVPVVAAGPDLATVLVPPGRHTLRLRWVTTPLESLSYAVSCLGWAAIAAALARRPLAGVRRWVSRT